MSQTQKMRLDGTSLQIIGPSKDSVRLNVTIYFIIIKLSKKFEMLNCYGQLLLRIIISAITF